jgi:hypothetical protein
MLRNCAGSDDGMEIAVALVIIDDAEDAEDMAVHLWLWYHETN